MLDMFTLLVVLLCAASASARHDYIVGGSEAAVGAYKYQVSLKFLGNHACSGSLIGSEWVLTAGYCTFGTLIYYSVVVGMHDQAMTKGNPKTHSVSNKYTHPYYGTGLVEEFVFNDIALMKLKTAVDLSNTYVELANMAPNDGFTYAGSDCHISGWGVVKYNGRTANNLQDSKIDCLTNTECRKQWGSSIKDGHICFFDKTNKRVSVCTGDRGGPMTCKRNNVPYVVGVASWVLHACTTEFPSAYTRVSEYRDWIKIMSGL